MAATKVDYTKVYSESRTNILDLLSNTSNVDDPITSSSEFRKWIYSREPDVKGGSEGDFGGYPFIILHPSSVDPEQEGSSCDGGSKFVNFMLEIEVVTSDRGYGSGDGKGMAHMDTISNSIFETLMDKTNRATLRTNGLYFADPAASSVVQEPVQNELTFRRTFVLALRTRMQVSA